MSTSLVTNKERSKIFKNFIQNCIKSLNKNDPSLSFDENISNGVFNDVIEDHKKLLVHIIRSI